MVQKTMTEPSAEVTMAALQTIFNDGITLIDKHNKKQTEKGKKPKGILLNVVKLRDSAETLAIEVANVHYKLEESSALIKAVLTYSGINIGTPEGLKTLAAMENKVVDQIMKNPKIKNHIEQGTALKGFGDFDKDQLASAAYKEPQTTAAFKVAQEIVAMIAPADFDQMIKKQDLVDKTLQLARSKEFKDTFGELNTIWKAVIAKNPAPKKAAKAKAKNQTGSK